MPSQASVPLPRGWSRHVKSSLLHSISLASMALTVARGSHSRSRLQTELERARGEIALLNGAVEYSGTTGEVVVFSRIGSRGRHS